MSDTLGANHPQAETPDTIGAFPRLSDEQIAVLLVRGQRRALTDGEVLIRPGEHPSSLYVVLEGLLLTADTEPAADPRHSDEPLAVEVHGRGRFVGGYRAAGRTAVFRIRLRRRRHRGGGGARR